MNYKQMVALWSGITTMAYMCLFPPIMYSFSNNLKSYHYGPDYYVFSQSRNSKIDLARLLIQISVVCLVSGGAFVTLKDNRGKLRKELANLKEKNRELDQEITLLKDNLSFWENEYAELENEYAELEKKHGEVSAQAKSDRDKFLEDLTATPLRDANGRIIRSLFSMEEAERRLKERGWPDQYIEKVLRWYGRAK